MLAANLEDVNRPDFVALDKNGQIVLIAEVKGFPFNFQETKTKTYAILRLVDYLQTAKIVIPFAMLVDVDKIQILKWDGNSLSEPIICLNTADVLSYYEPKFRDKKIFSLYLKGLTEAWLRDLAYNWKSAIPPFTKEMAEIDLLQLIKNGTTKIY
ncbi:hypothetical protein [Halotia branconii]|uniref:Type I restriction enzyme R protein N-terminal domain-containing protein n=1 Tax=Halotia branconii CENA392 TaxID=1539056 RepID=A0AAJ6P7P7_9CYAN|nr:hypothetical protein [Halotia branconii]WGV23846.1 hypothetical protein QI031_18780 [Halotia branconii CENA392]